MLNQTFVFGKLWISTIPVFLRKQNRFWIRTGSRFTTLLSVDAIQAEPEHYEGQYKKTH